MRVPHTDYENYYAKHRMPSIASVLSYSPYHKLFNFNIRTDDNNITNGYGIECDVNFSIKRILIGNDFRIARDTLVAHHKLNPPYTDTEEYKNILMDNILYYADGKWVSVRDLIGIYFIS